MKTNFKVGDRVAVYGLDRNLENARVTATITQILDSGQVYTDRENLYPFDATMVHPKQCRKLKHKPKPRRVWITLDGLRKDYVYTHSDVYITDPKLPGFVEFVEALPSQQVTRLGKKGKKK